MCENERREGGVLEIERTKQVGERDKERPRKREGKKGRGKEREREREGGVTYQNTHVGV